jgi:hypothetical protein
MHWVCLTLLVLLLCKHLLKTLQGLHSNGFYSVKSVYHVSFNVKILNGLALKRVISSRPLQISRIELLDDRK